MIIFSNPGQIDPRCITVQGVSVKEGQSPIGRFGTGLKMAIAVLLRTGHEVVIHSGTKRYGFTAKTENIRGKDFGLIHMITADMEAGEDGASVAAFQSEQALGFTTELGKHWELWMAYRELWSNATDEGGEVWQRDDDGKSFVPMYQDGLEWTTIIVSGPNVDKVHESRDDFILDLKGAGAPSGEPLVKPLYENAEFQIFPGPTSHVFYQGLRVYTMPKFMAYTYNIKGWLSLSEDRQASSQYGVEAAIMRGYMAWDNDVITEPLVEALTAYKNLQENGFDWQWANNGKAGRPFLRMVAELRRKGKLNKNSSVFKVARSYWGSDFSKDFIPIPCPAAPEEVERMEAMVKALSELGLELSFTLTLSEDVDKDDEHEIYNGVVYLNPSMLNDNAWEKTLLVLARLGLKAAGIFTHKDLAQWLLGRLLAAKGIEAPSSAKAGPEALPEPSAVFAS